MFSVGFVPNTVEPNTLDVLDPLVLKGLGAPSPDVGTPFEASPPNGLDVEEVAGALKPNGDGSRAGLDTTDPSVVDLSTPVPPFGVKGVKETIGPLLVVDPKGLLGAGAGVVALFMVELVVDEGLTELPNPKLNLGGVDVLLTASLEVT